MNPAVITGEENRPDMIVTLTESTIFVLELTVGFETNIGLNTKRKANKYKEILKSLENKFEKVNFGNLSMGALGIVGAHCSVTITPRALGFQQQEIASLIKKIMCCCIRGTYNVFVQGIRHSVSLLFFPGDVLLVTLRVMDIVSYSNDWCP